MVLLRWPFLVATSLLSTCLPVVSESLLSNWNPGSNRTVIIDFVKTVTDRQSQHFVSPDNRIAVFDNDGTLWCEKPNYTEMQFAVDRINHSFPQHPEWDSLPHLKQLIDWPRAQTVTLKGAEWLDVFMKSSANMTVEEFTQIAHNWIAEARHPEFQVSYLALTFKPMVELIQYLHQNEFRVFLVTGGSNGFVRTSCQRLYGISPRRVIGSHLETKYKLIGTTPTLVYGYSITRFNNAEEKPVAIQERIGQKPILAFGNSNGDLEMLHWTCSGEGRRLGLVLLHDDAAREYAYGENTKIYRHANEHSWHIVSMKNDFKTVFATVIRIRHFLHTQLRGIGQKQA